MPLNATGAARAVAFVDAGYSQRRIAHTLLRYGMPSDAFGRLVHTRGSQIRVDIGVLCVCV